jgi:hypothetical protein
LLTRSTAGLFLREPYPNFLCHFLWELNRGVHPGTVQFETEFNLSRSDVMNASNVRDRVNPALCIPQFVADLNWAKGVKL